ncbi:hypothetical protein VTK56DRAFT_7670 [Thermocarpiscus australiensis]
MDPRTTLFTFMLQTDPSVKTVHLIGSWDNFTKAYTMERDSRRNRGQWRGCYTFRDIMCDGDADGIAKRDGGLKMGHTYYYYYELDGASETYDPSLPSTNTCPYLPGQTVNTLWIPVEQAGRKRSASLTSLREDDFKTMDPASKFVTPRPVPITPNTTRRIGSAPLRMQQPKGSVRSLSAGSVWTLSPRKLFSRKSSSSSLKGIRPPIAEDERRARSEGSRSRDISPESLRRFLVDDVPLEGDQGDTDRPAIDIPDDIVEENEDDDNFATSAVSETMQLAGLSPPPQRTISPSQGTAVASDRNAASPVREHSLVVPAAPSRPPPQAPPLKATSGPGLQSQACFSALTFCSRDSPRSPDSESVPGFYHSEDEEDDDAPSGDYEESAPLPETDPILPREKGLFVRNFIATLSTYSLPQTAGTEGKLSAAEQSSLGALGTDASIGNTSLLTSPIPDPGLDDLVRELRWIADFIDGKHA